ncbi:hypothetical protein [Methylocystis sp. ATCC 49242]|uniref:hypothetical protein n=1 Tax=Methylocystis sp. ATCC 49242 TaxID=622637 RepID=UPI0001F86B30|nr:hypothetical protein [Methylocystis sp. ATCC 49242]
MSKLYDGEELERQRALGRAEGLQQAHDDGSFDQGFLDGKLTGLAEGREAGFAEGLTLGAKDERARITAILTSDAARGREAAARHLAFETEMSAEQAIGALRTMTSTSSIGARQAAAIISHGR